MNSTIQLCSFMGFDLFLPWSKKKLYLTLGHEIKKKFSMEIFQKTKIFYHFHVNYREK